VLQQLQLQLKLLLLRLSLLRALLLELGLQPQLERLQPREGAP